MSTYLFSSLAPVIWTDDTLKPSGWFEQARAPSGEFIYMMPEDYSAYISALGITLDLIGHWDANGELLSLLSPLWYDIRPMGNEDGQATDTLDYPKIAGHSQRNSQVTPVVQVLADAPDNDLRFAEDNQPFKIKCERFDDGEGWGLRFTCFNTTAQRDIAGRRFTVYEDESFTGQRYTCANFSENVVDDQTVWQTQTPLGQLSPDKESAYFALTLGAVQEGDWGIRTDQDSATRYYWENNQ